MRDDFKELSLFIEIAKRVGWKVGMDKSPAQFLDKEVTHLMDLHDCVKKQVEERKKKQ